MNLSAQIDTIGKNTVQNSNISSNKKFQQIVSLPFGRKLVKKGMSGNFYDNLIYNDIRRLMQDGGFTKKTIQKIRRYNLPAIKSVSYFDSTYIRNTSVRCPNKKLFASQLELKYYRYRLPDHNGLQCYYVCGYDPAHNDHYKSPINFCDNLLYDWYGYLVLYNKENAHADVICIYYFTFGGDYLSYARYFFIDKNFNITVGDYQVDDGVPEVVLYRKFKISIKRSNNIVFTQRN